MSAVEAKVIEWGNGDVVVRVIKQASNIATLISREQFNYVNIDGFKVSVGSKFSVDCYRGEITLCPDIQALDDSCCAINKKFLKEFTGVIHHLNAWYKKANKIKTYLDAVASKPMPTMRWSRKGKSFVAKKVASKVAVIK